MLHQELFTKIAQHLITALLKKIDILLQSLKSLNQDSKLNNHCLNLQKKYILIDPFRFKIVFLSWFDFFSSNICFICLIKYFCFYYGFIIISQKFLIISLILSRNNCIRENGTLQYNPLVHQMLLNPNRNRAHLLIKKSLK